MFLGKIVLKICSKFSGEHPCWSAVWMKLESIVSIVLEENKRKVIKMGIICVMWPLKIKLKAKNDKGFTIHTTIL